MLSSLLLGKGLDCLSFAIPCHPMLYHTLAKILREWGASLLPVRAQAA